MSHFADEYEPVDLTAGNGTIQGRYYQVLNASRAAIWVGGVGGGWDTPAQELYPTLCNQFRHEGVASLRIRYHDPHDLTQATNDVLAGMAFLKKRGIETLALVGHSLGGAVVIRAALLDESATAVVALASQGYGTSGVEKLGPRCALLLVHGLQDTILPYHSSIDIYKRASEPKKLLTYPSADHVLDSVAHEISQEIASWFREYL